MNYAPRWLIAVALLGAGCDLLSSPSESAAVYALHRIGDAVLPTPANPPAAFPILLGDTLTIPPFRPGRDEIVVGWVRVYEWENGQLETVPIKKQVRIQDGVLTLEMCKGFCVNGYVPLQLKFVGDSLVQQLSSGSQARPRVYGRMKVL